MGLVRGPGLSLNRVERGGWDCKVPPSFQSRMMDHAEPTTHPTDLSDEFIRLSALESGLSLPIDRYYPAATPRVPRTSASARIALETILLDAVSDPPCYVLFSGGRDSSAMLAVAAHVARREGLPDPIPVTAVHPEAPNTDESSWQGMVLRHLRIHERVVMIFDGEQTLLSRVARSALARHGLLWPEAVQLHGAIYERLDRGCLVSGEGGDQLLGSQRITPIRTVLQHKPSHRAIGAALRALLPNVLKGRRVGEKVARSPLFTWLTPFARAELVTSISRASQSPLRWDRATMMTMASKPNAVFTANFETAIREYNHRPVNPLHPPGSSALLPRRGDYSASVTGRRCCVTSSETFCPMPC